MTKKQLQKANIKIAIAFPIGMAIKKQISLKNIEISISISMAISMTISMAKIN